MRICALFFVLVLLAACGGSSSQTYEGKLYNGEMIFSEGTDISSLAFGTLSLSPSAVELAAEIGELENDEEKNRIISWEDAVSEEISRSPKAERSGKRLRYICDLMEFVDFEVIKTFTESPSARVLLNNPVLFKAATYNTQWHYKLYPFVSRIYDAKIGDYSKPTPLLQQKQTHEFLKANCPKYAAFMELVETNPLNAIEGKVAEAIDVKVVKQFLDRAGSAVLSLPEDERAAVYADAVCQVLSRKPEGMIKSVADFQDKEKLHIKSFFDLEDAIFDRRLKSLGIAKKDNEKRAFRKLLVESCPIYGSWVDYKREQIFAAGSAATATLGMGAGRVDMSFDAPDVPFNSFTEVDSFMYKLYNLAYEKSRELNKEEFLKWQAGQTCDCLKQLDTDYINDDDFHNWVSTAEMNYEFGVERPEDIKMLIYKQLFALYGLMVEEGDIQIPSKEKYIFRQRYGSALIYEKELESQCGALRKEILDILEEKPSYINDKFF